MWNRDNRTASLLYPNDPRRSRNPVRRVAAYVNWEIVAGFMILLGFFTFVLVQDAPQWRTWGTIGLVLVGWVFSLCLHEFAHATTAFLSGDRSDSTASYLTFNPLKYLNPLLSIVMPIAFILIGGIGLPGGSVYLHPELIPTRGQRSAVALAGPAMNLLVLLLIAIPFALGVAEAHSTLGAALGLLAFFQAAAIILNLLPIPGLDGFGAISPWLDPQTRGTLLSFGWYPTLLLFLALSYFPPIAAAFFDTVDRVLMAVHIEPFWAYIGLSVFQFWHRG